MDSVEFPDNKLFGFYRGTVLKLLNHGKCKIYIPGVYNEELKDLPDKLPDCEPAPPLFGGTCKGNGMFSYPNVGSTVWCFFENQDINIPVYFAATLGGEEAKEQYDDVRNVVPNDSFIHKINCHKDGDVVVSYIKMYETGLIIIATENTDTEDFAKIILNSDGNIDIASTKTINITSKKVTENATLQLDLASSNIKLTATVLNSIITPSFLAECSTGGAEIRGSGNNVITV